MVEEGDIEKSVFVKIFVKKIRQIEDKVETRRIRFPSYCVGFVSVAVVVVVVVVLVESKLEKNNLAGEVRLG